MTPSPGNDENVRRLESWLEHQLRLLEILRYRFDGLQRILAGRRDELVAQAVDEIDDVRVQLAMADLHRDLAVTSIMGAPDTEFPKLAEVIDLVGPRDSARLSLLHSALRDEAHGVEDIRNRCIQLAEEGIGSLG